MPNQHSRRAEILSEIGPDPRAIADRVVDLEEQLEAAKEDRDRCGRMLLDVEGSLLAYWTDIPETEIERLRVTIRHVLDTLPSLEADLVAANSNPAKERDAEPLEKRVMDARRAMAEGDDAVVEYLVDRPLPNPASEPEAL